LRCGFLVFDIRQRRTDFSGILDRLTVLLPSTKDGFLRYCGEWSGDRGAAGCSSVNEGRISQVLWANDPYLGGRCRRTVNEGRISQVLWGADISVYGQERVDPSTKDGFLRYCGARSIWRKMCRASIRQRRTDFSGIVGWNSRLAKTSKAPRQRRTDFSGIVGSIMAKPLPSPYTSRQRRTDFSGIVGLPLRRSPHPVNVGRISQVLWEQECKK